MNQAINKCGGERAALQNQSPHIPGSNRVGQWKHPEGFHLIWALTARSAAFFFPERQNQMRYETETTFLPRQRVALLRS